MIYHKTIMLHKMAVFASESQKGEAGVFYFGSRIGKRMKGILALVLLVMLSFSSTSIAQAQNRVSTEALEDQANPRVSGEPALEAKGSGEIIVRFKPDATRRLSKVQTAHSHVGARVKKNFDSVKGLQLVEIGEDRSVEEAVTEYENNPDVLYAEPNYRISLLAVPNDPYYESAWGLDNKGQVLEGQPGLEGADMEASRAWEIETGSRGVIVALLDTGVDYNHPDLEDNMWTDELGRHGKDFVSGRDDPMDDNGHGTHVAGIVAGVGNNGVGVSGVMWKASVMALKVLDANGNGYISNAIEAIEYANANNASVINMSLGGGEYSQSFCDAIAASDAVVVAAAGNRGRNNDALPVYPASYGLPNLLSVAATDNRDQLASFSNYGAGSVHVAAPGALIYSTEPNSQYGYRSGTSMAAPYVSGLAGLILAENPELTNSQVAEMIKESVDCVEGLDDKVLTEGRINAKKALEKAALQASEVDEALWRRWPPQATEDTSKVWTIALSGSCDAQTLTSENIYVTNGSGDSVPVALEYDSGKPNEIKVRPLHSYTQGESYTLWIRGIKSVKGTLLNENIRMEFTII